MDDETRGAIYAAQLCIGILIKTHPDRERIRSLFEQLPKIHDYSLNGSSFSDATIQAIEQFLENVGAAGLGKQ